MQIGVGGELQGDTIVVDSANAYWQLNFRWKRLPGLPYAIALKAEHPDSIISRLAQDSIADANGDDGGNGNLRSSHSNIFSFNISGRISTDLLVDEEKDLSFPLRNEHIQLGLEGLRIRLMEKDPLADDVLIEGQTGPNGGSINFKS